MTQYYSNEKNVQILLALLKEHGIRKVIASPGTTNMSLVVSMNNDPYFEMFSSVDERSAAYMACGLAAESGEAVMISCTGATASRNYLPGLTEAYYRKLPVLAITSTQAVSKVGHNIAQIIDRSSHPNDAVKYSTSLPIVKDNEDVWECEIKVNTAILELKRNGGGPVHINLPTTYNRQFDTRELPSARVIKRYTTSEKLPNLPSGKIAVFICSHTNMNAQEVEAIDKFCASNNAIVLCDHTSNYTGKFKVLSSLLTGQEMLEIEKYRPDLMIHIGEITGDYFGKRIAGKNIWRVNPDGEIRDTFNKLSFVFEMSEIEFFEHYANDTIIENTFLKEILNDIEKVKEKIPELPYSNIWIASKISHLIPEGTTIHFGILNSLRSWNFFELPASVKSAANVGGFGIDGGLSALVGASLNNGNKLYFGIIGDLAFFYDMNVLGNRHVGNNLRIMLVNNGKGTEFRQFNHYAAQHGDSADKFIAAGGHFGNKSRTLVKNYAQDLGFEYLSAENKEEFENVYTRFLSPKILEKPIIFEVFTDSVDESRALELVLRTEDNAKGKAKNFARQVLGNKGVETLKKIMNR